MATWKNQPRHIAICGGLKERLRTRVKPVCQTEIVNHFNIWSQMKLENYLVRQKYIPKIQYLFNYLSVMWIPEYMLDITLRSGELSKRWLICRLTVTFRGAVTLIINQHLSRTFYLHCQREKLREAGHFNCTWQKAPYRPVEIICYSTVFVPDMLPRISLSIHPQQLYLIISFKMVCNFVPTLFNN